MAAGMGAIVGGYLASLYVFRFLSSITFGISFDWADHIVIATERK